MRAENLTRGTTLAAEVEVAASLWAKFWGLMGRPSLAPGAGLWLPDSNGIHMFFMRFPIDVVFLGRLDAAGSARVVGLREWLPAWTGLVPFIRGAHGCLELPAGTLAATSTSLGDEVRLG
jgi:uncharacterized membrane protein (UPF0127 family)